MPAKHQHALTREAAWRAKQMYAEVDSRGRRVHSIASIAKALATSETTVYRAVNGLGPYADLPEPKGEDELAREAAESAKRFAEGWARGEIGQPETAAPQRAQRAAPFAEQIAAMGDDPLAKLAADIQKKKEKDQAGDKMLNELTQEKKDESAS